MDTINKTLNYASGGTKSAKVLMGEIATRAHALDFSFFGGYLPNPDPILRKMGKDQLVYQEIQGDAHLSGVMAQRTAGVKSLLWDIDRGKAKSRPTKAILKAFQLIDMDRLFADIMQANYRGFQPIEVMWGKPNGEGLIMPSDVVAKPPEWFQFNDINELKFRTLGSVTGLDLPDYKFLLPRRLPNYKNPYGEALLSKCYWPAVFKKNGLKFWVTFAEKFGIPFMIGKLPRGAAEADYTQLVEDLQNMVQDAVVAVPDDASIEVLQPSGKPASHEIFQGLVEWCNAEMSKAIIGHAGGADSTPGKLGGEDNAADAKDFLVLEDKRLVEATINQLIKWIYEINFGSGEQPVFSMFEEEDIDLDQATRDKTLSDQGVSFSKEYYTRVYGFEDGDIVSVGAPPSAAPAPMAKPAANFAEKARRGSDQDQTSLDNFIDNLQAAEMKAQAEGLLRPVIDLIRNGTSYEEVLNNLADTYSEMDTSALQKMLQRAIYVSEMLGRANAGAN